MTEGDTGAEELPRYWSSGLHEAIRSENHTVELVDTGGGVGVEIDGVRMLDGAGYAIETFNASRDYKQFLTKDGMEKLKEVTRDD